MRKRKGERLDFGDLNGLVMEMHWIERDSTCRVKPVPAGCSLDLPIRGSGPRPLHMSDI